MSILGLAEFFINCLINWKTPHRHIGIVKFDKFIIKYNVLSTIKRVKFENEIHRAYKTWRLDNIDDSLVDYKQLIDSYEELIKSFISLYMINGWTGEDLIFLKFKLIPTSEYKMEERDKLINKILK